MDTLTLFSKNLNQRSLTPRWPLTPCLLRSHVWLYPRIIVSKSHDNSSMYVDTVINFAKYHIHTYFILRTYYVQNEWSHSLLLNSVQARQLLNSVQARQTFKKQKVHTNLCLYFSLTFQFSLFSCFLTFNLFETTIQRPCIAIVHSNPLCFNTRHSYWSMNLMLLIKQMASVNTYSAL